MPSIRAIRPTPLASAAAAVLWGLAGCGSTAKPAVTLTTPPVILDTGRVERAIEQSVLAQRQIHAKAACPSGILQRKGLSFPCAVTFTGGRATFTVDQLDNKGNVHYAAQ